jgi:hypothetical protein
MQGSIDVAIRIAVPLGSRDAKLRRPFTYTAVCVPSSMQLKFWFTVLLERQLNPGNILVDIALRMLYFTHTLRASRVRGRVPA